MRIQSIKPKLLALGALITSYSILEPQHQKSCATAAPGLSYTGAQHASRRGEVMDLEKSQLSLDDRQQEKKKPYRKPFVQVYGTLSEVTKSAPHHHVGTADNFGPGWQSRT